MSVKIKFLFPYNAGEITNPFRIKDMLIPDQEYELFGHIVDMGLRHKDDKLIPEKPSMMVVKMTQEQSVIGLDGKINFPDQDFFLCRADEFNKIPAIETSYRNNAIIAFLQALDPESFVIIEVSW